MKPSLLSEPQVWNTNESNDPESSALSRVNNETSLSASAQEASSSNSNLRFGISTAIARKESAGHVGFEGEGDFANGWVTGRLGLSVFNSDYIYWGGTLGARVRVPKWRVSPYVGAEVYLGDHKSCEYQNLSQGDVLETCEKVFLTSGYLESGLTVRLFKNTQAYFFTRGYSKIDQSLREELVMFYGTSLMFSL